VTLFLTDADVRASFDWRCAVAALRDAYAAEASPVRYPARSIARGDGSWLRIMSGVSADTGLMGAKLITVNVNASLASYLIPLYDEATVELIALLDGNSLTGYRTAATSALAADLLASAGGMTLAVIGSGFEAQKHVRAIAAVRTVTEINVYSPRPESRARFAAALADLGVPVRDHGSAQSAVDAAGLVVCAARSRDETPTLLGEWLSPGQTVVSVGSTLPEQREVDPGVLARADVIVADMPSEVVHDTGDLLAAAKAGVDVADRVIPLSGVVSGARPGRTDVNQIALYKSVGSGLQDLAVAAMCLRRAQQAGLGTPLPVTIRPVGK
jgi:alanine dehydrogenase